MVILLKTGESGSATMDRRRRAVLDRLDHAARALLVARPVSSIALSDILDAAQVASATFYKLFEDLPHFYQFLAERLRRVLRDAQMEGQGDIDAQDWRGVVIHMCDRSALFYETHPEALRLWMAIDSPPSIRLGDQESDRAFVRLFRERFAGRSWRAKLPDPAKGVDVLIAAFRVHDAVLALGLEMAGGQPSRAYFEEAKTAALAYLAVRLDA